MSPWSLTTRPSMPAVCLTLGALGISLGLAAVPLVRRTPTTRPKPCIKSPRETLLPTLSEEEIAALAYPPDLLPGGRDVETPYGSIKVFEWGPLDGPKVILLHGLSTPCLSLATLAEALVAQGCRVMLFDFFGRGYSDAPTDLPYDIRLYTSQILLVLASSHLSWTGDNAFHLVGYSLGGGIAVPFTRHFPHIIRSLVLIAGGGLVRQEHVSWQSKVLYSAGIFPEWVLEALVRRRLTPVAARRAGGAVMNEEQMAGEVVAAKKGQQKQKFNHDSSGGDSYDNAIVSTRRPGLTVSAVMDWQVRHQRGFVHAFMSSVRYAPIYEQREDWLALGGLLAARREMTSLPGLLGGVVLLVLGQTDPVIIKEELIHDATEVLGEEAFEAVCLDAGHEVIMTQGERIVRVVRRFWEETGAVGI